jgi:hypothetical protein
VERADKEGNKTIMKIRGALVEILCELDESYEENVVIEGMKADKVLYVHVSMAIYGMLIFAMLF